MELNSKQKQYKAILNYLKEHKSMTPMDAALELGCLKLSTRINEMEREGYIITKHEMETNPNTGKRYCRYTLVEDEYERV